MQHQHEIMPIAQWAIQKDLLRILLDNRGLAHALVTFESSIKKMRTLASSQKARQEQDWQHIAMRIGPLRTQLTQVEREISEQFRQQQAVNIQWLWTQHLRCMDDWMHLQTDVLKLGRN